MARGTTNQNVRGSASDRRARKWWLLATFEDPILGPGWTRCYRCPALLCFDTVTVDRIVPGCQGGSYRRGNIRPACLRCNSSTGAVTRGNVPIAERRDEMKIDEQVSQMDPRRHTRRQAARLVGRDEDTLRRWKRLGYAGPTDSKTFGQLVVDLYSDEDIAKMRELALTIKPGRKRSA